MTYEESLNALSDPRRRAIFESLRAGAKSVAAIAVEQPVSRPAVSQHLKVLQTAGLVQVTVKGTRHFYQIRRDGLNALREYIESFWQDTLDAFATHVHDTIETEKES
ncbi:MAG: DNA-binding transcriptional ArsR family regulator [Paracoccaceae bacterium]|jgi:DNA-binding transcriptional ArsR family regulator